MDAYRSHLPSRPHFDTIDVVGDDGSGSGVGWNDVTAAAAAAGDDDQQESHVGWDNVLWNADAVDDVVGCVDWWLGYVVVAGMHL